MQRDDLYTLVKKGGGVLLPRFRKAISFSY